MAQLTSGRSAPRAASVNSITYEATTVSGTALPSHYFLPPTIPSPFSGTLEASLDAILEFARQYPQLCLLTDTLLADVDRATVWVDMFQLVLAKQSNGRELLEEFLFLISRTLLPEQIVENRGAMFRMYSVKRNLSLRVMLRYDMLRKWQQRDHAHYVMVESLPPFTPPLPPPAPVHNSQHPARRALLPNIIPTLIAAGPDGYLTKKMSEAMKHHVTELDRCLLFTDEEVAKWDVRRLLTTLGVVVLQWQWVRENTELLMSMEIDQWEDLDIRADENEWVRDLRNKKLTNAMDKKQRRGRSERSPQPNGQK